MSGTITPTQMAVIEYARARGGVLYRQPGGLWNAGGPIDYIGTYFNRQRIKDCIKAGLVGVVGIDKLGRPTQVAVL